MYSSCVCYHSSCLISDSCVNEYRTATVVAVDLSFAMYTRGVYANVNRCIFGNNVSVLFGANKASFILIDFHGTDDVFGTEQSDIHSI